MKRNINKQQNSFKKSKTSGNEIPLPTNERLEKMVFALPVSFPSPMMPVRIPELYHKMKNRQYPDFFYFSILALGNRLCNNTITDEDKKLESLYAKESLGLLKQEKDIRNPLYLWACQILKAHHSRTVDTVATETLRKLSSLSVRISKIYQLDLSKIAKMKYTEEELEFRRRVFWGNFPTVQDRDIVVNLPKNDFLWRYGGECKDDHPEIIFWNHVANSITVNQHPKEKHKELVKTLLLHGKITNFARRRWVPKVYNPDNDNFHLIKLIENLNEYSDNIVTPNLVDFEKIKEVHEKYENTLRMTIHTEIQILNYLFNQVHNSMKIVLYQTEMVRVKGRCVSPERVVSAKNIIAECAEKQIDMLHKFNKVLPPNHSENIASSWTLVSGVVCLNLMGINPSTEKARVENKKYSMIFNEMKKFSIDESDVNPWLVSKYGSYFTVLCCFGRSFSTLKINEYLDIDEPSLANFFMNSENRSGSNIPNIIPGQEHQHFFIEDDGIVSDIPTTSNTNIKESYKTNYELYTKYSRLLENSAPNSYGSYFTVLCCFGRSFSTLKINEYLDIDEPSLANFFMNSENRSGSNIPNIIPGQEHQHFFIEDDGIVSDIPTTSNTNIKESYKTNYELYTKYSRLLENSAPNSVHNYLFQHLVNIYSTKIVEDILSNPVNNQNSFDFSFNIPSTSYNFYDFSNRVESEEDEGN
ncbi:hypothetical protein BB559_000342 [Furculomyces boomerangus]|uniref:Transcription factor domain-containing protein n=1 Tax=Furculomyces boomerangus TaxID=61424 RepID=A0A2T9Z5P3_9FUNG|nr:hypothetical protein BB559_000342 [Furculomyces boomerangus]